MESQGALKCYKKYFNLSSKELQFLLLVLLHIVFLPLRFVRLQLKKVNSQWKNLALSVASFFIVRSNVHNRFVFVQYTYLYNLCIIHFNFLNQCCFCRMICDELAVMQETPVQICCKEICFKKPELNCNGQHCNYEKILSCLQPQLVTPCPVFGSFRCLFSVVCVVFK